MSLIREMNGFGSVGHKCSFLNLIRYCALLSAIVSLASFVFPSYGQNGEPPSIALEPSSGPIGSNISVGGKNFAPDSNIDIYFADSLQTNGVTMSDGTFEFQIVVHAEPEIVPGGVYSVSAVDSTKLQASAEFTVTNETQSTGSGEDTVDYVPTPPEPTDEPNTEVSTQRPLLEIDRGASAPSAMIHLYGSGFSPRSNITVSIDKMMLTREAMTDPEGYFDVVVTVPGPEEAQFGVHQITAEDSRGLSANAQLQIYNPEMNAAHTLIPQIMVEPQFSSPGATVNIYGRDFPFSSRVVISMLDHTLCEAQVTSNGMFLASFTVPSNSTDFVLEKPYIVVATDDTGIYATTVFVPSDRGQEKGIIVPSEAGTKIIRIEIAGKTFDIKSVSEGLKSGALDSKSKSLVLEFDQGAAGGLTEITIPKGLLGGTLTLFIDGVTVEPELTQTEDSSTLVFNKPEGSKVITISGTEVVPEFPLVLLLAGATVASITLIVRIRGMKPQ